MAKTVFHVEINRGPEQTIKCRTGVYQLAAMAALAQLKYKRDEKCDIVKIWLPDLIARVPDPDMHVQSYGPYFYGYDGHNVGYISDRKYKW